MSAPVRLTTPLSGTVVDRLRAGDHVLVTGRLYTARDAAHLRLRELDEHGEAWPFPAEGCILYYTGPSPARPGNATGAAGPTTASRMDALTRMTLHHGFRAIIGKGNRGAGLAAEFAAHHAVYMVAAGGAGAVAAMRIVASEVVAFDDLGPEAIRALDVVDFGVTVANDVTGADVYSDAHVPWRSVRRSDPGP